MESPVVCTNSKLFCFRVKFDQLEITFPEIFRTVSRELEQRFGDSIQDVFDSLVVEVDGGEVIASFYYNLEVIE
jgi:hypothetical protein